jgi:hypothetical protein
VIMKPNRIFSLLSGAAALAGVLALAPNAQAACAWNGYSWQCNQPIPPQVGNTPLPSVPTGSNWANQRYTPEGYNYNNYDQIPNDYPGPALTMPEPDSE